MLSAKEVMEKIINLISASASATKDAATSVVSTLIEIKNAILNILNSAVVKNQSTLITKLDSSNEKLDSIIAKDNQSEVVMKIDSVLTALQKQDTILTTLTEIVTNQTTILNTLANQSTAAKQEEILTKLSILNNLSTSAKQDEIIGLLTTISTK